MYEMNDYEIQINVRRQPLTKSPLIDRMIDLVLNNSIIIFFLPQCKTDISSRRSRWAQGWLGLNVSKGSNVVLAYRTTVLLKHYRLKHCSVSLL